MNSAKLGIGLCIAAACVIASCSKTKYGNTPSISLKSVSESLVPYDTTSSLVIFTFDLSEKTYNAGDTLFVWVQPINCPGDSESFNFQMTSLASGIPPTNTGGGFKGTMQAAFSNGSYYDQYGYPDIHTTADACPAGPAGVNGTPYQDDTCIFKFVVGSSPNYSDTAVSGPIILKHS
jgi:hypothetical protein